MAVAKPATQGPGLYNTTPYTGPQPIPDQLKGVKTASWEEMLLNDLGVPINNTSLTALALWGQSEGTAYANNPLAISTQYPGAVKCIAQCGTSNPIMSYDSMAQGVANTAAFLQANDQGIINGFKQSYDNPDGSVSPQRAGIIWTAINSSGWCRGCQGGQYPNALYQVLGQKVIASVQGSAVSQLGALDATAPIKAVAGAVSSATDWISPLTHLLGNLTSAQWWKRVGLGVLGIFLLVLGLIFILSETKVGQIASVAAIA